jgi:AbrB family looped-hinge helix DNA binding protein
MPIEPPCTAGYINMPIAHSRLTARGQVSVPATVRQKLGLHPGLVLEWDDDGEQVVVRLAGRYTSEDIHRAVFATPPKPKTRAALKKGVRLRTPDPWPA